MFLSSLVNTLSNVHRNLLDLDINYLPLNKENCVALQFFLMEHVKNICKDVGIVIADVCYIQGRVYDHGKNYIRSFLDKDDTLSIVLGTVPYFNTEEEIIDAIKLLLPKICKTILLGLNKPHDLFVLAGLNNFDEIEISLCIAKTKDELDSMCKSFNEGELDYRIAVTAVALADVE